MRISRRMLIAFLVVALFPVLAAQVVFYYVSARSLTRRALSQLESVAAIQEKRIESIVAQNLERLALVASRTQLRLSLASFTKDRLPEQQAMMDRILRDARASIGEFLAISVLTLDGKVAASTGPSAVGADLFGGEPFTRGRSENCADILFLDAEGRLKVFLAGPLRLNDELLGVVVVESDADTVVSVVGDYSGLGETGETILARSDGDGGALFLTPARFDRDAALRRTVPGDDRDSSIIQAVAGEEGLFTEAEDYRGEPVFACARHVEGPGWGLVVKMDKAEVLAPIAGLRKFLVMLVLASAAAAMLTGLWFERSVAGLLASLLRAAHRAGGGVKSEAPAAELGELTEALEETARRLSISRTALEKETSVRRRVEDALQETMGRYRDLVENVNDLVQSVAPDGSIIFVNHAWREALGYGEDEIRGLSIFDIVHPDSRAHCDEMFRRVMAGEDVGRIEADFVTKDGRAIMVEGSAKCRFEGGRPVATYSIFRDVTERRRAERQIRLLISAIEQSTEGIAVGDLEPRLTYVNEAFARMHGYSPEEMIGIKVANLHSEEQMDDFEKGIHQIKTQGSWTGEIEDVRRDGTPFPTSTSANLVKDEAGSPTGILAVCRDITEHRQLEAQLVQAQKMEAVGRLAGGVAHDFNNLMTIITGYSELALKTLDEDAPLRKDIEAMKKAGERAAGLTRQLLAFSRRQILQPKPLDLNVVVAGMGKMLGRLIGEDIGLVTILEASPDRVEADPGQLEQIIMNLAINARDAMPEGGKLTIETHNSELDDDYVRGKLEVEPGTYVVLAISDTGSGMDEETRSRIFEPFFTTKEEGKGTGLGLSTVFGIVKQHKGHVTVYSEPGRGTTFKIYLPRVEVLVKEEAAKAAPTESLRGTETILLVEDEDVVRMVVSKMLQMSGYTVLEAHEGEEALLVGRKHEGPIHLMLTDVVMPGMGGRELAERIAELHPAMKVIYMSGYTDNAIVHRGVLEPGTPFIEKPFTPDGLARKVREVLDAPGRT